jgi:hypothetical protein
MRPHEALNGKTPSEAAGIIISFVSFAFPQHADAAQSVCPDLPSVS